MFFVSCGSDSSQEVEGTGESSTFSSAEGVSGESPAADDDVATEEEEGGGASEEGKTDDSVESVDGEPSNDDEDGAEDEKDGSESSDTTSDGEASTSVPDSSESDGESESGDGDDDMEEEPDQCLEKYDPECEEAPPGMICIPAGTFEMGTNEVVFDEEEERHAPVANGLQVRDICMPTYYIDKYEVTRDQFNECVTAGVCEDIFVRDANFCNWGRPGRGDHPMNCIPWWEADKYCRWAGKRLPTEAEWEKAARGTDGRIYPWGNDEPSCARVVMADDQGNSGCGRGTTWSIGSKPLGDSPYGVTDMAGNEREFVSDWFAPDPYDPSETDNPQGPSSGEFRVIRGGAYFVQSDSSESLRATSRFAALLGERLRSIAGFRCASSQP